ncbi:MAG: sigma-54 dependent transcriptional regulator [candidate division Zixibacteria bacterium]
MPDKSIIYGDICGGKDRSKLERRNSNDIHWVEKSGPVEQLGDASLVFVDLDNPEFSSPDFLVSLAHNSKEAKIVGKSKNPTIDEAIRVSKLGVSELLTSDECLEKLHYFLEELKNEIPAPPSGKDGFDIQALVGNSKHIQEIRKTILVLSDVDFPSALILGETGTGKSLISKILHSTGVRAASNMVEVNCSAIPDELFEAELFGHSKGAFTDAKAEKLGLFEFAQNGILFLDEVGNLTASAQAKLLKILEDKKLRRVGEVAERNINVRVVAATNLDLKNAIESGKFREDLYFRLNLLTIEIPPLRERPEDIPELVHHFLRHFSSLYSKPQLIIKDEVIEEMKSHYWAGNIRELSNVIEKAVLLNRGRTINLQEIRSALKKSRVGVAERKHVTINMPPRGKALDEIEAQVVLEVLNICEWNKSQTAEYLKISRPRLRRIIDFHKLEQNRRKS